MAMDSEAIAKLSKALTEDVAESVTKSVTESLSAQMKESFDNFNTTQSSLLNNLIKAHEAFEVKTDKKFSNLMNRQDRMEEHNNAELSEMRKEMSQLKAVVNSQSQRESPSLPAPPNPSSLPFPSFANIAAQKPVSHPRTQEITGDLEAIKKIVSNARTILGIGPITAKDIENASGTSPPDKLCQAAIEFLREEIGVRENEVSDEDIIETFAADNPDLHRVYVKFRNFEQAELCLNLTRKLRKPELNVVLYIPKEMKERFSALKNEDYRLRKQTIPKRRTRIEYSETDLVLYICPVGHFRFLQHCVPDLPPVNLGPDRTPPPGRKSKRPRSDNSPPEANDKKKERAEAGTVANEGGDKSPASKYLNC